MPYTKEEIRLYNKKYREEHKEELKAWGKKYHEEHKIKRNAYCKKYHAEHKEERKEIDKISHKKYNESHKAEISLRAKKYYEDHKEDYRLRGKKWYENNKELYNIRCKEYNKMNPEINQNANMHRYGITLTEYNNLFIKQNGVCAICGLPETMILRGKIKRLAVDHDHETGKVRGLLCHKCNVAIGHMNDDPKILLAAIEYLVNS